MKVDVPLYGDLGKLPRYGNFISDMADNPAQMKDIGFRLGTGKKAQPQCQCFI